MKTIRAASAKTRPVNAIGELLPGSTLKRAQTKRRLSDAAKPAFMKKAPIVRMEPTIPFTTGPQYMRLKNSYRPQTAPEQRLTDSSGVPIETGTDPRFSSQVGFHLFGFSDIQKTFPIKDKEKATEYESADDYLDAMTVHDRKVIDQNDVQGPWLKCSLPSGLFHTSTSFSRSIIHTRSISGL